MLLHTGYAALPFRGHFLTPQTAARSPVQAHPCTGDYHHFSVFHFFPIRSGIPFFSAVGPQFPFRTSFPMQTHHFLLRFISAFSRSGKHEDVHYPHLAEHSTSILQHSTTDNTPYNNTATQVRIVNSVSLTISDTHSY
jgi:hypothetical protein